MICKFCGNVIEDNSDFCFICGQKVVADAPAYSAQVYSQKPEGAPAEPAPVAPAAPAVPVYAPPVVPVEEPTGKKGKKAKKVKKEKKVKADADPASLSKAGKILTGLLAAIFLAVAGIMCKNLIVVLICVVLTAVVAFVYYKKYKEAMDAGYEEKALDILNIGMIGLCVGMAIVVLCLVKTYMLG